ncbi:MAG TPA: class I SAM-dependent methyltransferase [Clostridia bacterium]|nr:class I SAM-dependent methyltransferase [Clostridia bacterium]
MNEDLNNAVKIKNLFIVRMLQPGGFAVDATAGNGHDSLFLSDMVGKNGKVLGFDIQESAIGNSRSLLESNAKYNNYRFVCDCHTRLSEYIDEPVDIFVYNLGYLPGGDKSKTTNAENTILSVKTAMSLLKTKGSLLIVCYPGHESGYREEEAIRVFSEELDQRKWSVLRSEFINQVKNPPVLYFIQKR